MQIGPYRVVDEIARGGMGVVYRAQDAAGQAVALKLLLAHRAQNPRARQRFQAEVNALARLRHPHVVAILGAGEHEGCPWLALEYVQGESLEACLRRGPLPIHAAIRVAQQLAQALSYVHSCGVLHRDLKPDNVLLRGNEALLTDFGLVLDEQSSVSRITATGVFQGTPGYWAPEQAQGETDQHGERTDVYGLGAVLYACLTGQPPVQAGSLQEYLQTVRFKRTAQPRKVRSEVPAWLSELCMRCLALLPASRPGSADEVARALVLAEGSARAAGAGRKRTLTALAAVVGVAGLVALGGWSSGLVSGPAPADEVEQPSEAEAHLELGVKACNEGRFADAIEHCDRALALDPELGLAWSYRGASQGQLGRLEEAIADLDRALSLIPKHTPAWTLRGRFRFMLGRYAEAIDDCDTAIELDPKSPTVYVARGGSNMGLGRYAEAVGDYDTAIQLAPRVNEAYAPRGNARAKLGRYAEALEDYDTALRLGLGQTAAESVRNLRAAVAAKLAKQPSTTADTQRRQAQELVLAGDAMFNAGRFAKAIEDYEKALELDPQYAEAYTHRGASRAGLGRHEEAIEDFNTALELDPRDAKAYRNRGVSKTEQGRFAEAIEDFDTALELNPGDASAYRDRGTSKGRLGRTAEAIEDYTKALELDPRDALAYANRGASEASLGRLAEAIEDLDTALELDPGNAGVHRNRGTLRIKLGRTAEAIEDFDALIQLEPRDAVAYANRGACKGQLGRYAEAIEDFDRAFEFGGLPRNVADGARRSRARAVSELAKQRSAQPGASEQRRQAQALIEAAHAKLKAGRFAEAIEGYDTALELDPRDAKAYRDRGTSKARLGRHAEAIEDFDTALELDPRGAVVFRRRGVSKVKLGRQAEAIEDFDAAIELDPSHAMTYANRGSSKGALGHYAEAIEDFDEALARGVPPGTAEQVKVLRAQAAADLAGD